MLIIFSLLLTLITDWVLRLGLGIAMPGWLFILLYLLFYYCCDRVKKHYSSNTEEEDWLEIWGRYPTVSLESIPLSGPIGKLGSWAMLLVFFSTQLLIILNPRQLWEVIRQSVGNLLLSWREWRSGENGQSYISTIAYQLPVKGSWLVLNGGMTPKTSHSWGIIGQRYALDFVKADEHLSRHRNSGTALADYYAYGEPVVAAADGMVIRVEKRVRNAPLVGYGVCDALARSFIGNYVVIQHADHEFGLYAHLAPNTVKVSVGDSVSVGQELGLCGHSGHSTEPHLHFHLQDSPDPYHSRGLPVRFGNLRIGGQEAYNARLRAGHWVEEIEAISI